MKIMLATYSACTHTSYGLVTRELWRRLAKMHPEWRIYQQGWFHSQEEEVPWPVEPTRVTRDSNGTFVPDPQDIHGQVTFQDIAKRFQPDVVWGLGDPYMMEHMGHYRPRLQFGLIKHCPADGAPQPRNWRDAMRDCDLFVPITQYAAKVFQQFYDEEDLSKNVIYHGVNTDIFQPMPDEVRMQAREEAAGISKDTFVLGFNGAGQYRKQAWNVYLMTRYLVDGAYWVHPDTDHVLLDTWDDAEFCFRVDDAPKEMGYRRAEPRKVLLWHHVFKKGNDVDYPAEALMEYYGVQDHVKFSEDMKYFSGVPDVAMPGYYNALDLYVSLTGGEGFDLPLIEAAACGIPCVYTDYSGHVEIGQHSGLPVRPYIVQRQMRTLIGRAIADVGHAVQQVRRLMDDRTLYERLRANGLRTARETFSWDRIAVQWEQAISEKFQPRRVQTLGVSL